MKVRDAIRMIEDDGRYHVATRGSHRQYKHPAKAGRVTTAGKAVEAEIRDAIRFHIEGLKEDGLAVPVPAAIAEDIEA